MIEKLIGWSINNRIGVLLASAALCLWGVYSMRHMPLDAIPDLSDTQVIVKTMYPGQSPQIVEDQVTYPLTTALMSVPRSSAVRAFSMFGESSIYVIFEDGTDPYWARARVSEYLNQLAGKLPPGVTPSLGPDASGVGWIFEYALVDKSGVHGPDELRAIQDFYLKYELQSLPGVAEAATIGGMARQFQVELAPERLAAQNITASQVAAAIRSANESGGGSVTEMGRAEYMIRSHGYLRTIEDFELIPVGMSDKGIPVRLKDVANIHIGPETRRGVADLDGEGEVTGGIVVMRYGHNALETINRVKARLEELKAGLPSGVELVVTYDRSGLIKRAIDNLVWKLLEESAAVAVVCLLFLFHLRSSLVAVVTLPMGILAAFGVMKWQGVSADIMSLGGVAIAIGAMVDASMVMMENMCKRLEKAEPGEDIWEIARKSSVEVGPALFFSLLVITASFLPVFWLGGQEGKLFSPLAFTKTFAMAASAALAVTLTPALMGYFIRGGIRPESRNPLNIFFQAIYKPALLASLDRRKLTLAAALAIMVSAAWPAMRIGSEFMPPLYEGDMLYMPTTLPGVSADEAAYITQMTDGLIKSLPEVERVFGKAGRAESATDPAPLSMLETTILLKPQDQWPAGETIDDLIRKLDETVNIPGLTNSWGYPIRTRIDMLSTGIRTPLGVKITGPELEGITRIAEKVEAGLKKVKGTRGVFADRVSSGRYIDITLDRLEALRYGVSAADVREFVQGAIGGETIGYVLDGRKRFSISMRYPRDTRESPESIGSALIPTPSGASIPLSSVATVSIADGPSEIKSENGRLTGYVYIDVAGRDIGGYAAEAKREVERAVKLEPGYALSWSGQYISMERARERFNLVVPLTGLIVFALLYIYFRNAVKVAMILLSLPFALAGGFWLVYLLGYNMSVAVAVAVGFIALAGVAVEFGVVMILYIDNAVEERLRNGVEVGPGQLRESIIEGALMRIRPKMMTVTVIVAGLLPMMLSSGTGSDVMQRIAAPLVGGMFTAPLLSLFVTPALYCMFVRIRNK
ncbi:MAG: efflux RND transporter permease subunit [Nitrospinae bacterium]|nr:efflux RND transporter permease subunit [Nitrospinota bacterium]